jgi:hypothetical protein
MKIKSFLYNQETEATIDLAYKSASEVAKKLGVKLKPEKDFRFRMNYAIARARKSRWSDKLNEIKSIRLSVGVSYHSPWSSASRETLEYSICHELTDAAVTDIGLCSELINYASSIKIVITVDYYQAWRRQARKKQQQTTANLKGTLSGSGA